jgi:hypothetical protein
VVPFLKNAVAGENARGFSALNVMLRAKTSRVVDARQFCAYAAPVRLWLVASSLSFLILAAMVAMENDSKMFGAS